jgi:hypothetical protein
LQGRRFADDGDEDRGAEHGADLAEGGVDGAGGGEAVAWDVAHRGGAEGREGKADADAGETGSRQPEAEPVRRGAGRAQHHHAGGEEEGAGDDHGAVAEAVGELASGAGNDRRERRPGQRRGAGLEHGVTPDRGEEDDVAKDQREEGGGEEQGAEVADAEGAVAEELWLDDRARMAAAAPDHAAEQEGGGGEAAERRGRGPAPVIALDDPQRDQGKAEGQHQRAGQVGQAAVELRALAQGLGAKPHHSGSQRQVDEEDQAPVVELDQGAAQGRPHRCRGRRGRPPDANTGGTPL